MTRKQADKFCGKYVKLTFKTSWFNEAVQTWVNEEEEYTGWFDHCENPEQSNYYKLDSDDWLPTHNACWTANSIKKIVEV